mmetsp:Transcript_5155/g.18865  ORF Transcript_5155/g.18865 Transcript_5155/m.18865 type:complete len:416 (-) Transcript_5155:2485-3732(-)
MPTAASLARPVGLPTASVRLSNNRLLRAKSCCAPTKQARASPTVTCAAVPQEDEDATPQLRRRDSLAIAAGVAAGAAISAPKADAFLGFGGPPKVEEWDLIDLPVSSEVLLLDVAFCPNEPNRGFLTGTRQTLLQTVDSGETWEPVPVPGTDEGFNYRFNAISFVGDEGWIVGKPAILLHTSDAGRTWERIPLNSKLPGVPMLVKGIKEGGEAEMTTDQGAIYVTSDGGYLWKAAVQETVEATLNRTVSSGISGASFYTGSFMAIARSDEGNYVAVNQRGNFYMTWSPGDNFWMPHNRNSGRRIQNMGYRENGGLWLLARGGQMFVSEPGDIENFEEVRVPSRGYGLLGVGYKNDQECWAGGGSGSLYKSADGGRTWSRDKVANESGANLYAVKFFSENNGYILGSNATLYKYRA